jgi:hypothetical protein
MIEVFDDGKGMDPDMLRNKALAKGLINEHQALTSDEACSWYSCPVSRPRKWLPASPAAAWAWTW